MDTSALAGRWAHVWAGAWPSGDSEAIAVLYSPTAVYRSHPHREPEPGGAAGYTARVFAQESATECVFGRPIAEGRRAAVEWWATLVEQGAAVTLTGVTVLTFDASGLVVDHVDYWTQSDGHLTPYAGWADRH